MAPCSQKTFRLNVRRPSCSRACVLIRQINRLKHENKKLRELIYLDPMTGSYNFRYLIESLLDEMKKATRTGEAFSVIMIDLDDFKKINDTYGHTVGDIVLKEVVRIIKNSVRTSDKVFRYGGEEFTVILTQTKLDDAIKIAERIRKAIESAHIRSGNTRVSVTASLGVYSVTGSFLLNAVRPEAILDAADQLLLKAKREGKNMVMWRSEAAEEAEISLEERRAILSLFPRELGVNQNIIHNEELQ